MKRHRVQKTFGRVPRGALFMMKDDPDGRVILKKTGKNSYTVHKGGSEFARGLKFFAREGDVVKRGRQH